jgi:hypothetical protein
MVEKSSSLGIIANTSSRLMKRLKKSILSNHSEERYWI